MSKNKLLGAEPDMAKEHNVFLIGCNVNQWAVYNTTADFYIKCIHIYSISPNKYI